MLSLRANILCQKKLVLDKIHALYKDDAWQSLSAVNKKRLVVPQVDGAILEGVWKKIDNGHYDVWIAKKHVNSPTLVPDLQNFFNQEASKFRRAAKLMLQAQIKTAEDTKIKAFQKTAKCSCDQYLEVPETICPKCKRHMHTVCLKSACCDPCLVPPKPVPLPLPAPAPAPFPKTVVRGGGGIRASSVFGLQRPLERIRASNALGAAGATTPPPKNPEDNLLLVPATPSPTRPKAKGRAAGSTNKCKYVDIAPPNLSKTEMETL